MKSKLRYIIYDCGRGEEESSSIVYVVLIHVHLMSSVEFDASSFIHRILVSSVEFDASSYIRLLGILLIFPKIGMDVVVGAFTLPLPRAKVS